MGTTVTERFGESADELWALLGDFDGIDRVFDGVTELVCDDGTRTFSLFGMRLSERLVDRDDSKRRLRYGIVSGVDVEHHEAEIAVDPQPEGCEVRWTVDVRPEAAEPLFADSYRGALVALRRRLEAGGTAP